MNMGRVGATGTSGFPPVKAEGKVFVAAKPPSVLDNPKDSTLLTQGLPAQDLPHQDLPHQDLATRAPKASPTSEPAAAPANAAPRLASPTTVFQMDPVTPGSHLLSPVPEAFSKAEVDRFYLTGEEGKLSPVGQVLFNKVRTKFLESIPDTPLGSPTLYMTGGIPGSGKGRIVSQLWEQSPHFVLVDADEIKNVVLADLVTANPALRPQMEQCKEWASVVHRTSRVMAHDLMEEALGSSKDILFDSTLASPNRQEYHQFVDRARQGGRGVHAIICNVDVSKAIERAEKRAKKPTVIDLPQDKLILPGRFVPLELIPGAKEGLTANSELFLKEGLFDDVTIYDNSRDGEPLRLDARYERVSLPDGGYTSKLVP